MEASDNVPRAKELTNMSKNKCIPSPLAEILKDYLYVEWIDEELLYNDMNAQNWKYDKNLFATQLKEAIEKKSISPEEYFSATGNEFDEFEEVSESLKLVWDSLFH